MLRKLFKQVFGKKFITKKNNNWLEDISTHTCNGKYDLNDCKACRYTSLKIGGFSDDCIRILMTNTIPKTTLTGPANITETTYVRPIETTDDIVKRISNARMIG